MRYDEFMLANGSSLTSWGRLRRGRRPAAILAVAAALVLALAVTVTLSAGWPPWRSPAPRQVSFWSPAAPAAQVVQEPRPVELGLRFTVSRPGSVVAIRFYRPDGDPGPHAGSLWDSAGTRLARVGFAAAVGPGWQQASLAAPVTLRPGREYRVSYHSDGRYVAAAGFFARGAAQVGPLRAAGERNGLYRYGDGAAPDRTFRSNNYFIDVVYRYRPARGDDRPPETTPETAPAGPTATAPATAPATGPTVSTPPAGATGSGPAAPGEAVAAAPPRVSAEVGPDYYGRWRSGPSTDSRYFPVTVWLQDPRRERDGRTNALNYRDLGVNTFVGLSGWPPDTGQLDALRAAGLTVIAGGEHGNVAAAGQARAYPASSLVRGYLLYDEPDMNQNNGTAAGGGCVPTATLERSADALRAADPSRPVFANFGKGMAQSTYQAPGCDNSLAALTAYARACDICSVDAYPLSDPYEPPSRKGIYMVGLAVDRLRYATGGHKPVWQIVETTQAFARSDRAATPAEVRSSVWMAIVHGARGIGYFAHEFRGNKTTEDGLLADARMAAAVRGVNHQLRDLAPVLNAPTVTGAVTVSSSRAGIPIDSLTRRLGRDTYVFAIGGGTAASPSGGATTATVRLAAALAGGPAKVEVIGEGRTLPVTGGRFTDHFDPYQVHLYRLAG